MVDRDPRVLHRRCVEAWLAVVMRIGPHWTEPTPCSEWDVRGLVNHVVGEDRWSEVLAAGRTIDEVGDALEGDLLGDRPLARATAAAAAALGAIDAAPADTMVHLSYGDEHLDEYLQQLAADHLVHGWDLAAAIGQDRSLPAELVDAVADWFAERETVYRAAGAIADRPARDGGSGTEAELLLAFGRDPGWQPPPTDTVADDRADQAGGGRD